jgi:hypothetical protein
MMLLAERRGIGFVLPWKMRGSGLVLLLLYESEMLFLHLVNLE